ncbi:lytic transglycosylase [Arthrobacter psychrolactophilus]|uniref:Lytic transglycosylase n=1 Tax=Arthrobacter psychrolactophilus TaxID=92442 RepID=A0A2V5IT69_9MICC|nr:LysM peptidoglycan-binding domain-containing protein [Arthrobacter psychrolactophilus]PYI38572.1 lytic transglycosylase [Arthrobacter psychrolactophilus]
MTPTRPSSAATKSAAGGKQLVAVATAAIPVVMLSSLGLAAPASASPQHTGIAPQGTHGSLDSQKVLAAVQARTAANRIPTALVASSVPRAVTALSPSETSFKTTLTGTLAGALKAQAGITSHTVVAGDTVSGIAAKYGVSTESVLTRNKISASTVIYPGEVLSISGSSAAATAPSTSSTTASASYTVRAGDTLSGIAADHKISLSSIFSLNSLDGRSIIHPGQKIKVGGAVTTAPSSSPAKENKPATGERYVIKAGDTLSAIAAKNNVSLAALVSANNIDAKATIYPGKTLSIPGLNAASSEIAPITQKPQDVPAALAPEDQVPSTFLHYTYPSAVVNDANRNKALLLAAPAPSVEEIKSLVASTASSMGVDPSLALAFALQESSFNHQSVSPANAIGTMQVIPDSGDWASGLVGRKLNLLDPTDNVTAGVAIIRALLKSAPNESEAIAGYYQGAYSVSVNGMFSDTATYVAGISSKRELFR